jgi:hypothetical protein
VYGVTIHDSKNNLLSFDLIDILNTVGEKTARSRWRISDVEASGNSALRLLELCDKKIEISGVELIGIASDLVQVISGRFEAYLDAEEPWLIVRAVDSSEYDVESDDPSVFKKLRQRFSEITVMPE